MSFSRSSTVLVALAVAPLLATTAHAADAQKKAACVAAFEKGQQENETGKLRAAATDLKGCADEACPAVVRRECVKLASSVDAQTPSIVVDATRGGQKVDATLLVDGAATTAKPGDEIPLDPGAHRLRVVPATGDAAESDVTVAAGEKKKPVSVTLAGAPPPTDAPAPIAPPPPKHASPSPFAYVLAGVGVVGLGAFGYFGLAGNAKVTSLDAANCAPHCASGDVDAARRDYLIANVSLGVGVVALGAATYLFLKTGKSDEGASVAFDPAGGARVGYSGRF